MNKIRRYFSTFEITRGFFIALLSSAFIYLDYWGLSHPILTTLFGLTSLYLLLKEGQKIWFFSGFFSGLFWFWWISVSFKHYNMLWAIPIGLILIALTCGILFWMIAFLAENLQHIIRRVRNHAPKHNTSEYADRCVITHPTILGIKALGLLLLSYIHPFGFDWFKPELMFVESYLGIEKWQFMIILISITLAIWKRQFLYLFLVLLAYQPKQMVDNIDPTAYTNNNIKTVGSILSTTYQPKVSKQADLFDKIEIVTTHTSAQDKWNESLQPMHFDALFQSIDQAIDANKTLVILPESVFPIFLNRSQALIDKLQKKAEQISIVVGGLYWDGTTPRNSTYIFTKDHIQVANKVILVPFGESNPLPDFLSDWVNKVFYDGAVDYKASSQVTDYKIENQSYRNAICFEATSEKLYEGIPENMIVLSNNGWFVPSTEPTLQKLLLQYYSKKYGTTIYHSVNMSESYVIRNGKVEN